MSVFEMAVSQDSIRTLVDPINPNIKIAHALVAVSNLPADFPLDPDPRVPKINGPITKRIADSLIKNDGKFHLLNRGITLSVKSVSYNPKKQVLTVVIPNEQFYGIIDGGHTHHAIVSTVANEKLKIKDKKEEIDEELVVFDNQFVHLEIMASIESHLADIAEARNYSIPLKAFTLANYRKEFQWFLDALGEDFVKHIKVSENDDQPVSIMDLIQVMCATNPKLRNADESYKNVSKGLTYFIEPNDRYEFQKMKNVARDIIKLNDYIRFKWKDFYNEVDESGKRRKFGGTTEANLRKRRRTTMATYFFLDPTKKPIVGDVPIEKGLSLPVISAFRALLKNSGDQISWELDPFKFFDEHGQELIREIMTASKRSGGDPHNVGREPNNWNTLYLTVSNKFLLEIKRSLEEKMRAS